MRVTSKASYAIPEDFQTLSRLNMVVYELRPCVSDFLALVVPVWYVPELSRFCKGKSQEKRCQVSLLGRFNDTSNYSSISSCLDGSVRESALTLES